MSQHLEREPFTLALASEALEFVPPNLAHDDWVACLMALHAEFGDAARQMTRDWSAGSDKFDERDFAARWRSFKRGGTTIATFIHHALGAGWRFPSRSEERPVPEPAREVVPPVLDAVPDPEPDIGALLSEWNDCHPIAGTVVEQYLQARNCALPPADGHLRFTPNAWNWMARVRGPAMVGLVTDAITGAAKSLHYTWVIADASAPPGIDKAARKLLKRGYRKAGGVVRLWPDEAVTQGLGVAEGIETALSLAHLHTPVWATIDAGNLAKLPILDGVETLVVAADHDKAGMRAASSCAERWAEEGREVMVIRARVAGADINDLVRAAA